jgi:DNA-binding transcriptional LysR family regulator
MKTIVKTDNRRRTVELRQLETFRAVARELSFSWAAAGLGYVQSSVSSQVAALERELGVPLFDRLGRRIALTEAGRVMLGYSERLLDLAEEAGEAVADAGVISGEIAGSLNVSAPETLLTYRLPELLTVFHEIYPKVRVSLKPTAVGRLVGSTRRALEEGRVDLAFVLDAPSVGVAGLSAELLMEEAVSVVAPPDHALADSCLVGPSHLIGETVLLPEAPQSGCAYRGRFERQLSEGGVVPRETLEFQSIEAIKRCVGSGMGVTVLPTVTVKAELAAGALSELEWLDPIRVGTLMAWNEARWASPSLRAFLKAAREVLSVSRASRKE